MTTVDYFALAEIGRLGSELVCGDPTSIHPGPAGAETGVLTATSALQSAEVDGLGMNDLLVFSRSSDQMESCLI